MKSGFAEHSFHEHSSYLMFQIKSLNGEISFLREGLHYERKIAKKLKKELRKRGLSFNETHNEPESFTASAPEENLECEAERLRRDRSIAFSQLQVERELVDSLEAVLLDAEARKHWLENDCEIPACSEDNDVKIYKFTNSQWGRTSNKKTSSKGRLINDTIFEKYYMFFLTKINLLHLRQINKLNYNLNYQFK